FIITFLSAIIMPGSIGKTELIAMAFPAMTEQYWYYTAYVGMFFFIPMMNHAIITFYKRYVHLTLIALVLLFSVFPVFFSTDVFGLRSGLSFVCIMLCYFIGAYLKHFDILKKLSNAKLIMLYAVSVILTLSFKLIVEAMAGMGSYDSGQSMRLYAYNSPTILVSAIALLTVFSRIQIRGKGFVRFVKAVSPLTFGIYLVNCHPLIWRYFMKDRFAALAFYPAAVMIVFVLLSAALLFIAGAGIDAIRHLIFEMGGLRKKLRKAEERFFEKADSMP
ncbi:MAG: hypothetical protein IK088_08000, partial [Lachnospiraceae bacterium]|nr:hypothetical protein [Lachnospiraceae bacterium]